MTTLPKVLIKVDMAEIEARTVAYITENNIDVLAETAEDEEPELTSRRVPLEVYAAEGFRKRRFGRGAQLAAAMAMLGGVPSGDFPSEPTVHDTLSANAHDHQGALDRAKAKRERKLQRNLHKAYCDYFLHNRKGE